MDPYNNLNNSGASNNLLGQNAVAEAAVVMNAYSPQYGRMAGAHVNLERAMRADGRFGGHIVQGHVDTTGEVVGMTPADNSTIMRFRVPPG